MQRYGWTWRAKTRSPRIFLIQSADKLLIDSLNRSVSPTRSTRTFRRNGPQIFRTVFFDQTFAKI